MKMNRLRNCNIWVSSAVSESFKIQVEKRWRRANTSTTMKPNELMGRLKRCPTARFQV